MDGEEYNGEITYSYAAENSENYKEGLPVDAGVNWVKASVPAQGNYAAAQSGDMKLTITKSIPAITLKNTYALSREYTGEAVPNPTADQMEITGAVYDNVEFSWDQEPVDAGTYTLTMKILATKNTEETVLAKTVTVTPKTVTAPVLRITPDSYEYTGSPIVPEKVEVLDGDIVIPESEYSFRYENNTQVGQATVTVTDNEGGNYTVSGEGSFAITKPSLASAEVALEESSFVYDKTQHKPAPTVLKNGRTLTANTDYTVSYENNINAGEATVTVTGMGNYSGEKIVYFTITPKELTPSITGTTTKTYDGTTAAPAGLSITLDGREGDDDVTATAANYAYNSPNVNGATTITASGITLSGTAAGNYKLSSDTAKIAGTITKDTSATAPAAGEGYTLDYTQETIAIEQGYEVSTAETDGTAVTGSITAYLGGKLYIRKIEDSNHAASGWTEFTLAARPQAPTLDATGETLLGQKDGLVSGVDTDMEYSTDGSSTWTACIGAEITGLGGCTVLVRVKATATAPHGEVSVCTIGEGRPITVTFDRQDGSSVETQTNRSYGEKLVKPEAPTREDYAFQGWYKESDCTTAWDFANDTLTAENVTLYAKWRKVRFKVGGTVKDSDGNTVVGGATVTLMKGSEQLDQGTTDENGGFTFSQHIEAGAYNIVTTYTPENGSPRIKTTLIALTDSDKEDVAVTLPPEGVNSTLTVSTGSNTPAVVVGGLDEEAAALKAQETTAATVTVSMEVEGKSESQVGTTVAEAIKEKAKGDSSSGEPMVEYLDISVTKQVDETKEQLTETKNVIEIVVPFDFTGKEAIVVVRYHGDSAEKFAEASDGEKLDKTYKLDKENGYIYIYASKFSTYAVGYTAAHTITFNANGGTVGKNSDTTGSNGKLSALPTPTRDGYTFLGWYTSPDGGTVVTTGTAFTGSTTIYAHWEKKSSQGGGGSGSGGGWYPTVSYYSVKVNKSENGTVTASPTSIYSGGTVTLTVKPDEGYKLDKITVTDSQGKAVELTEKGGKYTFKMPSRDVTVKAEFAPVQTATPSPGPTGSPSPSPSGSPTLSPSPRPWKNPFPDVKEGQWYIKAIEYVCTNGLMAGYSNGKFGLNDTLTRAQFAQIIYNKEGRPQASGGKFTDVTTGWYADAVNWAASEGIVAGVGGGRFAPDQPITRQDLAVMLWRYAGNPEPEKNELDFHDAEKVSGYAWKALCWANEKGIVNGKGGGILDPKGNATRAQAAQMLMKYLSE